MYHHQSYPKPPDHQHISKIWFSAECWMKIHFLLTARGGKHEFSFFGIANPDSPAFIQDIWIPPQRCFPAHTSPDRSAIGLWLSDRPPNVPIYWCHTHPNMSANPSSDDTNTLEHLTNAGRPVAMIIFARNDARVTSCRMRFPIYDPEQEVATFIQQELPIDGWDDAEKQDFFKDPLPAFTRMAEALADLDLKCKPPEPVVVPAVTGTQMSLRGEVRGSHSYSGDEFMARYAGHRVQGALVDARGEPLNLKAKRKQRIFNPVAGAVNPLTDENNPACYLDEMDVAISFMEDKDSDPSWDQAAEAYDLWRSCGARAKCQAVRSIISDCLKDLALPHHDQAIFAVIPEKSWHNSGHALDTPMFKRSTRWSMYFPETLPKSKGEVLLNSTDKHTSKKKSSASSVIATLPAHTEPPQLAPNAPADLLLEPAPPVG